MAKSIDLIRYAVGDEVCYRSPSWYGEPAPILHVVEEVELHNNATDDSVLIQNKSVIEYQLVKLKDGGWIPAIQLFPWDDTIKQQLLDYESGNKQNKRASVTGTSTKPSKASKPRAKPEMPSGDILLGSLHKLGYK